MTKVQVIRSIVDGKPAFAVVPWADYERLIARGATDEDIYDRAKAAAEETLPIEVVDRLLAREHPIKVYREHRGLTQAQLAQRAGLHAVYISQIETGRRRGSVGVLREIATALGVDLDDIVPSRPRRRNTMAGRAKPKARKNIWTRRAAE